MEAMQQPHRMRSYLFNVMTVLTYQLHQSIKSVDKRQSSDEIYFYSITKLLALTKKTRFPFLSRKISIVTISTHIIHPTSQKLRTILTFKKKSFQR